MKISIELNKGGFCLGIYFTPLVYRFYIDILFFSIVIDTFKPEELKF